MKKKVLIIFIICVLLIAIIATCILVRKNKKYGVIEIERSVATFTDSELEYVIEDESILIFDHLETKSNRNKDELGGTYKQIYYFTGKKEGITYVTFKIKDGYGNISEKYEYEVTVDKNLYVSVKKGQFVGNHFIIDDGMDIVY